MITFLEQVSPDGWQAVVSDGDHTLGHIRLLPSYDYAFFPADASDTERLSSPDLAELKHAVESACLARNPRTTGALIAALHKKADR